MLDTLASSRSGGGGRETPPAPPVYDGDMPWERDIVTEAQRAIAQVDLNKTAPFLAYLALNRSVFDIGTPVDPTIAPYGRNQQSTLYSAN